jgi:SOS response regulatory protein OraA/RecX
MSIGKLILKLMDLGASKEIIAAVVESVEANTAALEARRTSDRERKRKQRMSRDIPETVTGQSQDLSPPSLPLNGFPPSASNIDIITPLPSSPISPPSINFHQRKTDLSLFKDFWDAYPRKTAKGAAEKAWAKAILHTSGSDIIRILKRVKWPDDAEFVPHPSTWLNQRRWEDEGPKREITQEERDERARVYLRSIGRNV